MSAVLVVIRNGPLGLSKVGKLVFSGPKTCSKCRQVGDDQFSRGGGGDSQGVKLQNRC